MQNFNFNHLYYFHVVASEGSLARAAKVLRVTQPTISEQIKQLESFLGTKLFDRRPGGGLRLNQAGRQVYEHTSIMFRTSTRLLAAFIPRKLEDEDVFDLGVSTSVFAALADGFFLPLLHMDGLRLRLRVGDYDFLLHELISLEIDLVLADTAPPDPGSKGLKIKTIHEPKLIVVANPEMAERITSIPENLSSVPFLDYTANSKYRWEIERYFTESGIRPEILGEVDDVRLMLLAATRGLCFVIVPEAMATNALESGELRCLGRLPELETRVLALYHQMDTPSQVKEVIERLTQA